MPQLPSIDAILDASTIELIRGSSAATCEILDPASDRCLSVALTSPRELSAEQLAELKRMLLDANSWWFAKKRCMPKPVAIFRLASDERPMTVLIDSCEGWTVAAPGVRRGGFFDPVQDQVRAMIKALFPEYASASPRSMWRAGAIAQLRAAHKATQQGGP